MKKWYVIYWDDSKNSLVKYGCKTYEDAKVKEQEVMKKFNRFSELKYGTRKSVKL